MFYLKSAEANVKLGFDFVDSISCPQSGTAFERLPDIFNIGENKYETWVPFVLHLSTPEKTIAITENLRAYMTVYEAEKIYHGLNDLLSGAEHKEDRRFTHYSSESLFEITIEHLSVDECFEVELWFIVAEGPEGRLDGYHAGFRFITDQSELENFAAEFYNRFIKVCPWAAASFGERKYYPVKIVYQDKETFAIWYGGDEDGFLMDGQNLLTFERMDEVKRFSQKWNISLEKEESLYDFNGLMELICKTDASENCRALIDAWNFFSDLAGSVEEEFKGDSEEEQIRNIYDRLFWGSNLQAVKGEKEEYHPDFCDEERKKCISVLESGFTILNKQFR